MTRDTSFRFKANMDIFNRNSFRTQSASIPLQYSDHLFYSNNTLIKSDFMDGIKILTVFTHLFSYSFNFILLYVISKNRAIRTKAYITHLIWVELLLNVCQHLSVEYVLQTEDQTSVYVFKMVFILFMTLQMWTVNTIRYMMTFVMAINRFICIINPKFNKYFDSETITFFGAGIWMLAFIGSWYLLLLGCFPRFNSETFVLETDCDYFKWPDFVYKSHYLLLLTLILNILIVVYAKLRRCGFFKVAVARVSAVAAHRRSRHETYFIIQSLIVFLVMAYDAVYTSLRKNYELVSFNQSITF
uniref:7TM_GPCR_Srx domain-containing protein n=1 Tax=Caenorhabditis tropicalis TaxID=1561998 RepID=A0A1I7TQQ8_9PELO